MFIHVQTYNIFYPLTWFKTSKQHAFYSRGKPRKNMIIKHKKQQQTKQKKTHNGA